LGRLIGRPNQQEKGFDLQSAGKAQVHLEDVKEFEELEIRDRDVDKRSNAWLRGSSQFRSCLAYRHSHVPAPSATGPCKKVAQHPPASQ
jgi:hypothetical protein